jgi:predicted site-specific integrase-resolvase
MFKYVTPEYARKYYDTSDNTLRKWEKEGKLEAIRIGPAGKHRRYKIKIENENENGNTNNKEKICYARVSSKEQKEDLERQVTVLRDKYPNHKIIKDIGSGINFKRKGFKTLLQQAINGNIEEVVVTNKDRLCRFGFELVESIISASNGKIVVLYNHEKTQEQELVEDVITILTVFSSRLHGRRSHRNKRNTKQNMDHYKQGENNSQNLTVQTIL